MTQTVLDNKVTELQANTGLDDNKRQLFAAELENIVADTYNLLINTQTLHWNVQGPLFYSVHKLTEGQYEDMFEAIDVLAERARTLGFPLFDVLKKMSPSTSYHTLDADADLRDQIGTLIEANEQLATTLRKVAQRADQIEDVRTADLLTERVGVHEENAWMLKATIASA